LERGEGHSALLSHAQVGVLIVVIDQSSKLYSVLAFGPEKIVTEAENVLRVVDGRSRGTAEIRDGTNVKRTDRSTCNARIMRAGHAACRRVRGGGSGIQNVRPAVGKAARVKERRREDVIFGERQILLPFNKTKVKYREDLRVRLVRIVVGIATEHVIAACDLARNPRGFSRCSDR